ncbi:MAG: NADH-quinone oxidoreductase subunit NuoE [Desulfobacteraceae bacterium]|nr:NADH-quinone oxidoreductase subunit NuoE [Desulfobacteraceae bacterium]
METQLKIVFSKFEGKKEELIPLLQASQASHGFLSKDAMLEIAGFIHIPESKVFAVATFYTQFRFTPVGKKHVMACRGTACHVRGAPRILSEFKNRLGIEEGETSENLEYSLETVACIGACGLAPCAMINDRVEAKLTPKKVVDLFSRGKKNEI